MLNLMRFVAELLEEIVCPQSMRYLHKHVEKKVEDR